MPERGNIDAMRVNVSLATLVALADRLGSQSVDVCPTDSHICWRHRDFKPYIEPVVECRECWLTWILRGQ
jgi:hypothetical protein